MKRNYYLSLPYTVRVERISDAQGERFWAEIKEWPECRVSATTWNGAYREVKAQLAAAIDEYLRLGKSIPEPTMDEFVLQIPVQEALYQKLATKANAQKQSLCDYVTERLQ